MVFAFLIMMTFTGFLHVAPAMAAACYTTEQGDAICPSAPPPGQPVPPASGAAGGGNAPLRGPLIGYAGLPGNPPLVDVAPGGGFYSHANNPGSDRRRPILNASTPVTFSKNFEGQVTGFLLYSDLSGVTGEVVVARGVGTSAPTVTIRDSFGHIIKTSTSVETVSLSFMFTEDGLPPPDAWSGPTGVVYLKTGERYIFEGGITPGTYNGHAVADTWFVMYMGTRAGLGP